MRIGLVGLALVAGCGSTDPTESRVPDLGTYHVEFAFDQPGPFGGVVTGYVRGDLVLADADETDLTIGGGGEHFSGPATLAFWNVSAYAVHVPMYGGGVTAQLRLGPRFTTCSGSVRYPQNRVYTLYGCTIARVP